ncbi:hypothetical protein F4818DRAFT_434952 [Hypoxylon cercidicola]|nr:hypothetical protein F4818DRAFT_434952 [Hypoxylon cercidicola]
MCDGSTAYAANESNKVVGIPSSHQCLSAYLVHCPVGPILLGIGIGTCRENKITTKIISTISNNIRSKQLWLLYFVIGDFGILLQPPELPIDS